MKDAVQPDLPWQSRGAIAPAVLRELEAVVGPAGVLKDPHDIAAYCRSWRDDWTGAVPVVLRPANTGEVAALVKLCAAHKVAIVPQGGRTGLTGASQPHADLSEVIITTERMNKIIALDLANDTMTVDAGVILKDIQTAADNANRFFPLSLGAEGSCRIGGNISTNAGGVQVLRYGNTRALVLGLEVVMPDGRVWNGLRSLRKDNTGYDLKQLFIAGEGTLGIITKAVLRLFPKPTASETAWIAVESPEKGVALLAHMKAAMGDAISAFELICRQIIDVLITSVPGHADPMSETHPWYVLMDVTGQGAAGCIEGAVDRRARGCGGSGDHHRRADRELRCAGGQTLEDARGPRRGPVEGRRQHRPRHLRAGLEDPRVPAPRRRRDGRGLSRRAPLLVRPCRRWQHALQSDPSTELGCRTLPSRKACDQPHRP